MNKSAHAGSTPRFSYVLRVAACAAALAVVVPLTAGCVTGESTFQTLPGGVFGGVTEHDDFTYVQGDVSKRSPVIPSDVVQPTALGDFEYTRRANDPWIALSVEGPVKSMLDGSPQTRRFRVFTSLVGRERICASPASDFVVPYLSSRSADVLADPVAAGQAATRALLEALGGVVGAPTTRTDFARACLSDGMTDEVRVMILTSLMLESARASQGAQWLQDAAWHFDENGTLRAEDVAAFRAAFKDADIDRLEAEIEAAFDKAGATSAAPYLRSLIDQDFNGIADVDDTCVAVQNAACACGNGVLDHGEACDGGLEGPTSACARDCSELAVCGDGIVQEREAFDRKTVCSAAQCRPERCPLDGSPAGARCDMLSSSSSSVIGPLAQRFWSVSGGGMPVLFGLSNTTLLRYSQLGSEVVATDARHARAIRLGNGAEAFVVTTPTRDELALVMVNGDTTPVPIFANGTMAGEVVGLVSADMDGDGSEDVVVLWDDGSSVSVHVLGLQVGAQPLVVLRPIDVLTLTSVKKVQAVVAARTSVALRTDVGSLFVASATPTTLTARTLSLGAPATRVEFVRNGDGYLVRADERTYTIDSNGDVDEDASCVPVSDETVWAASDFENEHVWAVAAGDMWTLGTWRKAPAGFAPTAIAYEIKASRVVLLEDGSGFVSLTVDGTLDAGDMRARVFGF